MTDMSAQEPVSGRFKCSLKHDRAKLPKPPRPATKAVRVEWSNTTTFMAEMVEKGRPRRKRKEDIKQKRRRPEIREPKPVRRIRKNRREEKA